MHIASHGTQRTSRRSDGMSTGAGRGNVSGDQSLGCWTRLQASRLASMPTDPSASLPGIATVALYRSLPAPGRYSDKLSVGLHLGPAGWMEWHTAEQGARRMPVPCLAASAWCPPGRASGGGGISRPSSCWSLSSRRSWRPCLGTRRADHCAHDAGVSGPGDRPHPLRLAGEVVRRLSLGTPLQHLAVHGPGDPFGTPLCGRRGRLAGRSQGRAVAGPPPAGARSHRTGISATGSG